MNITTNRHRNAFMVVPSFVELKVRTDNALIEQCGFLCSVREHQAAKQIAMRLDTPLARLYEKIANDDYSQPESFLVENVTDRHLGQVFLSAAIGFRLKGNAVSAGRLLTEASKLATKYEDAVTVYQVQREKAIARSIIGDHKSARAILSGAYPLARLIYNRRPVYWYDYLNSWAVELAEAGQLDKAQCLINIALASPFAGIYDGWLDTSREIAEKREQRASHSVISGSRINYDNVFDLADARAARPSQPQDAEGAATVSSLTEHRNMPKKTQTKEPEQQEVNIDQEFRKLGHDEKEIHLTREIYKGDLSDDELEQLMNQVKEFRNSRRQKAKE